MCITIAEVKKVFQEEINTILHKNSENIYDKIMDKIPQIIASSAGAIKHETAPETHTRLVNLEEKAVINATEHQTILEKIDHILENNKENSVILKEIRDRKTVKHWIKSFFKDWWFIITVIGGMLFFFFKLWLSDFIKKP